MTSSDSEAKGPRLSPGTVLHGFQLDATEPIKELPGTAWIFTHQASGLRLLWIENEDPELAFSITFKTPPADDTGVFHILEHSVLDGSKKYPVKEPFVELLKTSMATFINALTFPDKTMYPVSSTNANDLEHLMDVYLDAVFDPDLYRRPSIFEQEGWHYELKNPEAPLTLNGVVLNEMKGALSDPDDMLFLSVERALFPNTCYRWESGGDPKAIPTLTYEAYCNTHSRHYTPKNAHAVLYGAQDIDRELAFLDQRLHEVPKRDAGDPNPLELQAPTGIVQAKETMAMAPEHAAVALGYVFATSKDRERVLAADILIDAIAGSNEAPLKRAILESGLGNDFTCYMVDAMAQPFVLMELKGAKPWATEPLRATVHEVCMKLIKEGIGQERLEASLAQAEFALREGDYGYPTGIYLSMASMASWLYDEDDPLSYLRYEDTFAHLREGMKEGLFEELLSSIIGSDHSCLVELRPGEATATDEEAKKLQAYKETLTEAQLEAICQETVRLHEEQATPDSPKALATLPRLAVSEIGAAPPEPAAEPIEAPAPSWTYDLTTHGIDYVTYYFGLESYPAEELPYLSILSALLGKLDTEQHSASELDTLIESKLGDLSFFCESAARFNDPSSAVTHLVCAAAALDTNKAWLAALPHEVWAQTRFSDKERIRSLLVQRRIGLERGFISAGHTTALARVDAQQSLASAIAQRLGGIDFYRFLCDLLEHFDERFEELSAHLGRLAQSVFCPDALTTSFAGTDPESFWALEPLGSPDFTPPKPRPAQLSVELTGPHTEAYSIPAGVDFVAKGALLASADATYNGCWLVGARALTYGYLWNEVRVLGGAYGAGLRLVEPGIAGFYSFRDPSVDPTLERFDKAAQWLQEAELSQRDVDGYIVACVGTLDKPMKPRALMRREDLGRLTGRPPQWRQELREQVLQVKPQDVKLLSQPLETLIANAGICVVGQAELLEASSVKKALRTLVADATEGGTDARTNQIRRRQDLHQAARLLHERARL